MITLITGAPGAGKSLYALVHTKARAERENRQVYYHGIKDLKLDWIYLENPEKWYELPYGSIFIHDEAQTLYRPRRIGSSVPLYESEFETHRHKGLDVILVTQHPNLISTHVRKLVGQHFHVKRKFGTNAATVHEWSDVNEKPEKTRKDSIRHDFIYPKSAFEYYKSAEIHTVKRNIPMRVYLMFLAPIVILAFLYFLYQSIFVNALGTADMNSVSDSLNLPTAQNASAAASNIKKNLSYLQLHTPEVPDLPFTAPAYEKLITPIVAPYPAACIESLTFKCTCYSQQGTKLQISEGFCRQVVENGFFEYFDTNPRSSNHGVSRGVAHAADQQYNQSYAR